MPAVPELEMDGPAQVDTDEQYHIESFDGPCRPSENTPSPGNPQQPYALPGPQVEFSAAYWLLNSRLRVPELQQVTDAIGNPPPHPVDEATLRREINDLRRLERNRDILLARLNLAQLELTPLSGFVNLQKLPFGAIFNTNGRQYRIDNILRQRDRYRLPRNLVTKGKHLARMFENETPGLIHRHYLNWFLFQRADLSPPRHGRVWAALDITIYAALSAAWYYKWAMESPVSFRQRPWEYDQSLNVLYDREVDRDGDGDGAGRTCPCPTPGTPRHPAYPSGHSTFSAAASRLLEYFVSPDTLDDSDEALFKKFPAGSSEFDDSGWHAAELRRLANNIGEARLWAGVHWRTDHTFGQHLGRTVADLIIQQLKTDCVPRVNDDTCEERKDEQPPSPEQLAKARADRERACPNPDTHDTLPVEEAPEKTSRVF